MTNDKLTYQQAKRLREQSLSSVFADQLIMGEGYTSGLAKTISLKTKARITGIKQKFDPLNIAKFLTGGSRLGPAILGKILGRSRKDIEFFTGRARPVTSRAPKIGALPQGEDTTGMTAVLNDVLAFLQKSHEDDMILREKENNLREGQMHEEEKRHKELLKALGVKNGKSPTATPVTGKNGAGGGLSGLLNSIQGMIASAVADIKAMAEKAIADLKDLKNFLGGARGLAWLAGFILNPVAWVAAAVAALVGINASVKADIEKDPNNPKYKDHPYAKFLRGETTAVNEKNATARAASQQQGTAKYAEIKDAVESDLSDEELKREYKADRPQLRAWLKDNPPSATYKIGESIVNNNAGDTNVSVDNRNDVEMKKLQRQNEMTPPPAVVPPPVSSQVVSKTDENRQVEMQERLNRLTKTTEQTKVVSGKLIKQNKQPQPKVPIIAVRNTEKTFRQVIYNSTRVV
jgi:hypothetical protein